MAATFLQHKMKIRFSNNENNITCMSGGSCDE